MRIDIVEDKRVWESFIERYSPGSLFQSWNWGQVLLETSRINSRINEVARFGLFDRGKLCGAFQTVLLSPKKGRFLHVRHGPIFSKWSMSYLAFVTGFLKEKAKRDRAIYLRISPLLDNSAKSTAIFSKLKYNDAPIHAMDGEYCWMLDISKDENQLLAGMRKTTRYLIKQAIKIGVEIEITEKMDALKDFMFLYDVTSKRHGFIKHSSIKEEFEIFSKEGQITMLIGKFKGSILSAALILFYNNQAIYHHSASIEQKIPVNYLLQWEAIKEAKRRGKHIYNFWGIAPDGKRNHPWYGLSTFKKGFGGYVKEYLHAKDLPFSPLYCTTYIAEILRKIRKRY